MISASVVGPPILFYQGAPITFPTVAQWWGLPDPPYNARGSAQKVRMPGYKRLDLSFVGWQTETKRGREKKEQGLWVFSVYNLYAGKMPFVLHLLRPGPPTETPAGQPILTSSQLSIIGTSSRRCITISNF